MNITRIFAIVGILTFVVADGILFLTRDEQILTISGDLSPIILSFLVVVCGLLVCTLDKRVQERYSWLLLVVAFLFRMFGESFWAFYELALQVDVPSPSVADIGWLISYVAILAGLSYKAWYVELKNKTRIVWGLLGAATLLSAVYILLQSRLLLQAPVGFDVTSFVINSLYVVFDIYIIAVLVLIFFPALTGYGRMFRSDVFFALAFVSFALFDLVFAHKVFWDTYMTGDFIDLFYDGGYLLLLLAAHFRYSVLREYQSNGVQNPKKRKNSKDNEA